MYLARYLENPQYKLFVYFKVFLLYLLNRQQVLLNAKIWHIYIGRTV
jgi:hypothetical protein